MNQDVPLYNLNYGEYDKITNYPKIIANDKSSMFILNDSTSTITYISNPSSMDKAIEKENTNSFNTMKNENESNENNVIIHNNYNNNNENEIIENDVILHSNEISNDSDIYDKYSSSYSFYPTFSPSIHENGIK